MPADLALLHNNSAASSRIVVVRVSVLRGRSPVLLVVIPIAVSSIMYRFLDIYSFTSCPWSYSCLDDHSLVSTISAEAHVCSCGELEGWKIGRLNEQTLIANGKVIPASDLLEGNGESTFGRSTGPEIADLVASIPAAFRDDFKFLGSLSSGSTMLGWTSFSSLRAGRKGGLKVWTTLSCS